MTHDPGPGGQPPAPYQRTPAPPGYPPYGGSPYGPPPGYPPPPPPRKGWSTTRILLVTLTAVLLVGGALVALAMTLVPLTGQPVDRAERDANGRIVRADTVDKDDLRAGDCVNDAALRDLAPGKDLQTFGPTVDVMPCGGLHDFEVFAAFPLPDGDYAEADAVQDVADRQCLRRLRRDWYDDRTLLRDKTVAYYMPPQLAPRRGNVVCMLQLMSGEQMRGSIR